MIIDLSLPVKNNTPEPESPEIKYLDHVQGAKDTVKGVENILIKNAPLKGIVFKIINLLNSLLGTKLPGLSVKDFPDGMGLANDELKLDVHAGTHLDAPWHFGPRSGDKDAITVDRIPLEWCFSDGVVLDFLHKEAGEIISEEDIKAALNKIDYKIKPLDIVLIMTGADKCFDKDNYFSAHAGMSAEATRYIINQGVKIIGIDAWGFDRPAMNMLQDYFKTRDKSNMLPAHFVGREMEYCHIEKLANLDKLPKPYGFKVACFPVKIENASAGWSRVVAICS
jgi:kynurenine formamidase